MDDLRQRIWELMGEERRQRAAEAFWNSDEQKAARGQVEVLLAQRLKARPQFIKKLPVAKKAAYLSRDMAANPYLWDAAMISYQFAHHRPMLSDFLNAVGIANKDGHYESDQQPQQPSAEALERAVAELTSKYDKSDAAVYLGALVLQDPTFWAPLRPIVDKLVDEIAPRATEQAS